MNTINKIDMNKKITFLLLFLATTPMWLTAQVALREGRRIASPPAHGVYIQNGRKYVR